MPCFCRSAMMGSDPVNENGFATPRTFFIAAKSVVYPGDFRFTATPFIAPPSHLNSNVPWECNNSGIYYISRTQAMNQPLNIVLE